MLEKHAAIGVIKQTETCLQHGKTVICSFSNEKYQQDHYFWYYSSRCISLSSHTRQFGRGWCASVRPNANWRQVDINLCKQGAAAPRSPSESSVNNLKRLGQMMNSSRMETQKVLLAVTSGFQPTGFSQSASLSLLPARTHSDICALFAARLERTTGGNAAAVRVSPSVAAAPQTQCEFGFRRLLLEEFDMCTAC